MNLEHSKLIKKAGLTLSLIFLLFSNGFSQTVIATIGNGAVAISGTAVGSPFGSYYTSSHAQYLITAAELNAAGIFGNVPLKSLGFNVSVAAPAAVSSCASGNITAGNQILNYTIKVKNTSATSLTTAYDLVGLTTVFNPSTIYTSVGWNNFTFNNSFSWDGTSNLLVDICDDQSNNVTAITCYSTGPTVLATTTGVNTVSHNWADNVASQCAIVTATTNNTTRPNIQLGYIPPPMAFGSSTTTQPSTTVVGVGSADNQILGLQITVSGQRDAFAIKNINLNTNGTTNIADIANAKIYYTGNSNVFNNSTLFGSATLSSGSYSIAGNQILASTGTHYFWVTYDVSGSATPNNLLDAELVSFDYDSLTTIKNKVPTVTAPAGTRTIRPRLNGTYAVGAGGNFTSLTAFANELNAVGVTGPVTVNLTDAVYGAAETFPITVNPFFGMGASNPIVIRPAVSNSNVLIQGNATSLITFSGAKYITIDGRPGGIGSNNLKFINASISGPVIQYLNDANTHVLQYCTVFSANASTTSGAIFIGGTTGTLGNDSLTFSNLNIRSSAYPATLANGIFAQGQSAAAQNDYVSISNNNFYAFVLNGILANATNTGIGSFWNISNNSFYDTTTTITTNAVTAINFIPAGTTSFSHTISNNYIGGSAPLCAGLPWTISSAAGSLTGIAASTSAGVSPTLIQSNTIQNISLTGGLASTFALTGINTSGTGTYTIGGGAGTANTIGHASTVSSIRSLNNSAITAITNSGTGIINITNNLIANLTDSNINAAAAIRGINNSGGSIVTISNNSLYNFVTQSTNVGVTTAAALLGVSVTSSGNPQVISNNTIGGSLGIFRNVQLGTHVTTGIYYGGASANNTISNNTISNFTSASIAAGTTSSAALNGLLIANGSTLNTVSGNTISNFTLSGAASTQVNAICETVSSTTNIFQNNTLYNFKNTASTSSGVNAAAAIMAMNFGVSTLHTILNNSIDSFVYSGASASQTTGLYLLGTTGNTITGNTISRFYSSSTAAGSLNSSALVGMNVAGSGTNQTITQNTLHTFISSATATAANIVGLYHTAGTTAAGNTSIIARNNFHSFSLSTTAAGAITGMIMSSTYAVVQNNIIRIGVNNAGTVLTGPYANRGIYLTAATYGSAGVGNGLKIYHNTIYLNGSYTSGTSATYGIDVSAAVATGSVDIRNNIIANLSSNTAATGLHYGLKLASLANIISNFNLFYTPGTGGNAAILTATSYASLAGATGWRALTKLDVNSASANPNFVSPTGTSATVNMRVQSPTPVEGMGDNTLTTTDNFDGAARSSRTPVDIGADAGNYSLSADLIAPYILFTPLANVLNGANVTLQASIYDNGGVYTSGTLAPRVYYKKGINGTYYSTAGTLNAGSSKNAQWNFVIDHSLVGGVLGNDSVYYYLIAQDSAGNIASNVPYVLATDVNTITTHPSNTLAPLLNYYKVVPLLSSPILVGAGNAITSLTAGDATGLFFNLNNGAITGNTQVLITSNITELGTTALNAVSQVSAGAVGNYGYRITIQPQSNTQFTLTSTNASGMIRLNGASGVTIKGVSPSGTSTDTNLVFVSQAVAPAILLSNDASNDSIVNMVIRGRNTSTGLINITSAGIGNGNDNNVIIGSNLYTDLATPYAYGIYMLGTAGKENDNTVILNNNIYNFTVGGVYAATATGINTSINNNHFYYNHPTALGGAWAPITLTPGAVSNGDTISGNYLGGSSRFCGGTALTNTAATTFTGISASVGTNTGVYIQGNTIQNINYTSTTAGSITGITISAGVANIKANTIGHASTLNSIQSVGTGIMTGINYGGTASIAIADNYIGNLTANNTASTTAGLRGIAVSATTLNVFINNNTLYKFYVNTALTGVTTATPLCGIMVSSTNPTQTITNNIISNFVNANTTAIAGSHFGIGTTGGVNNISNNQIRNFTINTLSAGTTTSAALIGIMNTSTSTGQIISNNLVDTLLLTGLASTQCYGVYAAGATLTLSNNTVRNIATASSSIGTTTSAAVIGFSYPSALTNNNIVGNKVYAVKSTNTTVSGINMIGIYASMSTSGANYIQKNLVHSFGAVTTGTASIFGIYLAAGTISTQNNMIRLGIDAAGNAFTGPYNVYGYYLATSSANNIYHNSIYISGNPSSGAGTTAPFFATTGLSTVNVKNNIFSNTTSNAGSASGLNVAYRPYTNSYYNSDYNLLYSAPGIGSALVYNGYSLISYTNLRGTGGWQSSVAATIDLNSANGLPGFVNQNGTSDLVDLHVNAVNAAEMSGDPSIASIVMDDYDGDIRANNSPVDVGADAGNNMSDQMADFFSPVISYTALTNTASIANRDITATLIDNYGVSTMSNLPTIYFRKGVNGTFNTASGTMVSGNPNNGNWSFTIGTSAMGGLTVGDTVFYFLAAQDDAGNLAISPSYGVGANVGNITTIPGTLNSYVISQPLATIINVGAGYPTTSLTANDTSGVFYRINNGFLQGNTVINIMSDTIVEPGLVVLNKWLEVSGSTIGTYNYSLSIRPGNGGTQAKKYLLGNVANALIRFNNASNITISGIGAGGNASDTNLVIRNITTTAISHFQMYNDASNINFQNVIMEGRSAGGAMASISTSTLLTGNDNISFNNCVFRADTISTSAVSGISCAGSVGKENDNISVIGCAFENINNTCISFIAGTGNNISIKNNHVYWNRSFASPNTVLCFNLNVGVTTNGDTISGNYVGGSARFCAGLPWNTIGVVAPIQTNVGVSTGCYIQGNTFQNITTTSQFLGMNCVTGGVITIVGNTIGHPTNANSIVTSSAAVNTGIVVGTPGNAIVSGNTIANIFANNTGAATALRGIAISGGTGNTSIVSNNTISNLTTNNTNTGTTTAAGLMGIVVSSSSANQSITGNTISNLSNTNATTSNLSGAYGILTTAGTNIISNNTINGISNASSYTGNLSANLMAAVSGIASISAGGGNTVSNNMVAGLVNLPAVAASTQIVGIGLTIGSNITCMGNTIKNLNTNSINVGVTTASALIGLAYTAAGTNNVFSQNTIHSLQLLTTSLPVANSVIGFYYSNGTAGNNFVTRNLIHSIKNTTAGPGLIVGLFNNAGTTTFSNNMLRLGIDSNATAYTGQIEVRGIYNATNVNNNFYHNTVYVGGAANAGGSNTYAFYSLSQIAANNIVNIRNNIFYNAASNSGSAIGFNYAMKLFDSLNVVSNNNIFAATGTGAMLVGTAGNYSTLRGLGGFNYTTGLDYNSATASSPFFVNATGTASSVNMRLNASNPAEQNGDLTISNTVSLDFDGNSRSSNTPSDIGASGGNNTASPDIFTPTITYTALGNTGDNVGPRAFTGVLIQDANGVPLTGTYAPKVYYKKGANGTYVSVAAASYTGVASNATFSFNMDYSLISGGVASNDTIFYYVLAQDNSGNIISNTPFAVATDVNTVLAHPRNVGYYQIFPSLPANTVIYAGVGQAYPSLTGVGGVFELLNNRSIAGNIEVRITSNITEPGFIALNQIGENGVGNYSVTICPDSLTATERVLSGSGSLFGLIILNGADRVKITGVPAVTGVSTDKKLRIRNSSTGVATILLQNDATGCKLNNLNIEGAASASTSGVVQLGISNGLLGNSTDTISGCIIRNDQTQILPNGIATNGIYSNSTITALNSNNVFTGNEILNFQTTGLLLDVINGNAWTITGNSFYNNLSVPTTSGTQTAINILPGIFSNGNNISSNYIGGSAANCGGTPYINLSTGVTFTGIALTTGTSTSNIVNANTIQNISLTGGSTANFNGINLNFGKFDITNNLIGHASNINSITSLGAGTFNGIVNNSTDVLNISGNAIQGININSGASTAFNGINIATGICTLNNNTIGHASLATSINFNSSGAFNGIIVNTVYTIAPNTIITNNRVANIVAPLNASYTVSGISFQNSSIATITGNNVHNIFSNSNNTSTNNSEALIGINYSSASPSGAVISQNNIYSLTAGNTGGSAITTVSGMYLSAATNPLISRNKIYDLRNLSTSTSNYPPPVAAAMNIATPGVGLSIVNNQIVLGKDQTSNTEFIGIWQQFSGSFTITAQNNSIFITGVAGSGALPSYAYLRGANSTTEVTSPSNLVNNIFFNNRTGGNGKHYAIANQVAVPTVVTGTNWNPNSSKYNLLVSANSSTIALWGSVDKDIAGWRSIGSSDVLSYSAQAGVGSDQVNADNLFVNPSICDLSVQTANAVSWYLNGKGIAGPAATDFNNATRGTTIGYGTDIGAFEFTTSTTPPSCTISNSIGTGNMQSVLFANREVAQITWLGATGTYPSAVDVKYYSGVNPPSANPNYTYLNSYLNMSATGGSNYTYKLLLDYDDALIGNMSSEAALNLAVKPNSGTWNSVSTSSNVNSINNTIDNSTALSSFGLVSGSNQCVSLPIVSGSVAVCANSTLNYSVPTNSNRTYLWTVVGGTIASGQGTASVSIAWGAAGSGSIAVKDSLNNSTCTAVSNLTSVTINPNPTPAISGVSAICENNSTSYTTPSASGRAYLWSISGGTITSGQATNAINVLWGAAGAGTISVRDSILSTGCSITTANYSVVKNAYPTPVITGASAICENNSTTYSTPSNTGRTYVWTVTGGSISSGLGTASITVAWGAAGAGTVVVTDSVNATGCKVTTATYNVVKNAYPTPVISGVTSICANNSATYSITSNVGRTYVWTVNGGVIASGQGTNSVSVTWGASGIGTIFVSDSNNATGCKTTTGNYNVTINPNPTPAISGVSAICENNSTSYTTPSASGRAYLWSISGGTITSGQATNTINVLWGAAGSGTLTVKDSILSTGCKITTANYSVVKNAYPTPVITGASAICENNSTTYSTPTNTGRTYVWNVTGGSISSGQGTASITVAWGAAGAGTVVVSDSVNATGCKVTTATFNVVKNPYPTPSVSGLASVCENSTSSYSTGSNAGRTYFWTVTGGSIASGQGTTNVTVTWGTAGVGTLVVSDSVNVTGCKVSSTLFNVTKNANPTPVIVGPNTVCANSSTSYSSGSNAGRTYLWSVTGGTIASGQGTAAIAINWAGVGAGTITLKDSVNSTGCKIITSPYSVSVNNSPSPVITGTSAICQNLTANYSTPANSGSAFIWQVIGGNITAGAGTNSITVQWTSLGAGSVVVTDSILAGGCKTTTSPYNVTVNAFPTPVISGSNLVCINTSASYSTPSNTGRTYVWNVSGGTVTAGAGTSSVTVLWNTSGAGTISVSDSVNATGCKTTTTNYSVTVNPVIANNSLTGVQTICSGTSASSITGTTPTGGNGSFTYAWESSTTSASAGFVAASGTNNTINYSPGILTTTTWFRRTISAGVCAALTSSAIQVTVNPVIANNSISGIQTICPNTVPTALTGSVAIGGNGTYTYLWESSTTSATAGFAAASGTNNGVNYSPASLPASVWYRRTVSAGVCTADVTAAIKVTVEDVTKPIVVVRNITKYLDATGNISITSTEVDNGSTDNCVIGSKVLSKTSFNCTNVGANSVRLVVTDLVGNKDSATATITIADTTKPNVITKNYTSYLDATGNTSIVLSNIDNGSSDNCSIASSVLSKTSFNCGNVGSNTVTLTVTDVNGNIKTGTSTVTILDTIKPIVNVNSSVVLYLNASGNLAVTPAMINNGSTDNCSIATMTVTPSSINCANIGITPITLTITDANGNVNSNIANVVIIDPIVPVARPKARLNLYLSATGQAVINAAQLDSASTDNCTITSKSISQTTFNCTHLGANTISFTVQDQSGNANAANVIITVLDTVKPVINVLNRSIYLSTTGTASITAAAVNNGTTDNCTLSSISLSQTAFTCANAGLNNLTFTATDAIGNIATATVVVTVIDSVKPIMRPKANLTAYLNTSGIASITAAAADSASTDNCSISSKSLSVSNFNCANIGSNNVSLIGLDAAGNIGSQNFAVMVIDTIKPFAITQNVTAYLDATGNTTITSAQINNGSNDNCSIATLSLSTTSFNCTNLGANTVSLTATDASGNFRTASSTVTILDTIKPIVAYNNPVNIYLNALGSATLTTAQVNNGSSDNCGIASLVLSKTSFNGTNLGANTVSFTVTDNSSNNRAVSITINVIDTVKPIAIAQNKTIYLDALGAANVSAAAVNNGSTDNIGITSILLSKTAFNCANLGANNVVLTIGDVSGNTATANAIITVIDTIKPIAIAQNLNVYLDGTGNASITNTQLNNSSSDNCGISSITISKSNFNCTNLGLNSVSLTVTDASGNFRTAVSTVTVFDTIKPIVTFNNNLNLYLNGAGTATLTTAIVNNGSSDNCGIASLTLSKTSFTGADRGSNVVTFTVTDNNSNSRSVSVNVIVIDSMRPIAIAQNLNAYLNASGAVSITAAQVNNGSTDNVGIASLSISQSNFTCSDIGAKSITLTVSDASGNISTAAAIVTVIDTIKPIAIVQNLTIQLNQLGVASITTANVNNGSSDNCSISSLVLSKSTFDCSNIGSNNVSFTATDASGNFRSVNVIVTVQDTIKPIAAINNNLNLYLNGAGTATLTTGMVNNGSTDNCGIASLTLSKTSFTGADRGSNLVTFTVTDNSSNSRSVSVNVIVIDSMRPIAIAQNLNAYLNASGAVSITAAQVNNGSTDNVGIASLSISQSNFTCSDIGAKSITLTVSDASGNISTAAAIVTVIDTIKPIAIVQNLTIQLNQLGVASITTANVNNGSSDNCSISSLVLSKSTFDCSNIGSNNVSFTATDASGNFRSVNVIVTVQDTIKPIAAINNNLNLYLNGAGTATLTTAMVNNGSSDNCGIGSLSLSKTIFTGADRGSNVVTFTVTDNSSNSRSISVNVIVIDSIRPIALSQNRTIYLNALGAASVTPAQVNNGSSDNVGVTSLMLSQSNFDCSDVGANTVTLTVGDASGNIATTTAVIIVADTTKPNVIGRNLTAYMNQFGVASITPAQVNNGSTDNCAIVSYSLSKTDFDCSHVGSNPVVLTVTDASNNTATVTVYVNVLDTLKPTVFVNNNLSVYLDSLGNATITPNAIDNGSYDNCAIGLRVLSKTTFNGTNLGVNVITFTATDPSSNSKTVSLNVIVKDSMVPIVRANNLTIYLTAAGSAVINTSMVDNGSSDNVGIKTKTLSKSSFNCSNLGVNSVYFTVRDASSNESIGEITVTVLDTIRPVISNMPINKVVGFCNAAQSYNMPTATDNCGNITVKQIAGLPSGSNFPIGITTNTFELSDESGNKVTASFTINVNAATNIDTFPSLEMCQDKGMLELSHGAANMTFSGSGIMKDKKTFDPMLAGTGNHTITAIFIDAMGCANTGTFNIAVYPVPDKPEIVRISSNVLAAQKDYYSYQWYRNNEMIAGATSRNYTVTQSGIYGLVVKNASGCENGSDPFALGVPLGGTIITKDKDLFNVYPNPSTNVFYIELKGLNAKGTKITLIDMLGKEVMAFETDKELIEMNVIDFAAGTYYVKLENGNNFMVKPIIIAK